MEHIYLDFQETLQGDVAILSLTGKMMGGSGTEEVHERVNNFLTQGIKKIVIDMDSVKWLNSSGIGVLTACLNSVQKKGGQLRLANLSGKDESLFFKTKLTQVFDHHKSIAEAIAAFSSQQELAEI
jgi:anti-sigma B factor antagonist